MKDSMYNVLIASYKGGEIIDYIESLEKALDEACTALEKESAHKMDTGYYGKTSFWNKAKWKEYFMHENKQEEKQNDN